MTKGQLPVRGKADSVFARLRFHGWLLVGLWTGGVAGSLLWNLHVQAERTLEMARQSAQITFDNDVLYRRWSARQGGVYVPVSEYTPANPYLRVPERDVTTTTGKSLTLVNPAYMARQVNALAVGAGGSRGHLTSLKPMRPENAPDAWETAALRSFEQGVREVSSIERVSGNEYLRLMRPFVTERNCLKCHAAQGYKEGDIRGGISVSVAMAPLRATEKPMTAHLALAHGGLWLAGLAGLGLSKRSLGRQVLARHRVEADLRASEARFRALYEQAPLGIARIDARTGRFLQANARFCEIAGRDETEMLALDFQSITHPDDRQQSLDNVQALENGLRRFFEIDKRYLRPDGSAVWVSLTVVPEWADAESPRSRIAMAADITARKQAEEQVQRKVEELRISNEELARFNRAMVDRELRMIELKKEVNEVCRQSGQSPRYTLSL